MDSNTFIIFIGGLALGVIAVIAFARVGNKKRAQDEAPDKGLLLLQNQIAHLTKTVDEKLSHSQKEMSDTVRLQFGESQRFVKDFTKEITEELTSIREQNKQVIGFADQLKNLQDILKNPKQRGVLGEYYLEALLKNVLPPSSYEMQYKFSDGEIVDAIVRVKDKLIPIDSKFSLENYNRLAEERNEAEKERLGKVFVNDLKLRIQETSKYIRPAEGTMDFAFMFIPHEAIYYDLLVNKIGGANEEDNLIQRAASKYKVIIVSPTSFLAYLQTVLQGLKALQIEETAKDIIKRVEDLGKHLKKYEEYHGKLGINLATVINHYNASSKELKKVDKDVLRITGESTNIEVLDVEKPELTEV